MNVPQRTLERDLQEALYYRPFVEALNGWRKVTRLSQLARTVFARRAGWAR